MLWIGFLYFIFATCFVIAKSGLAYAEPFFFVAMRMMIAGAAMLLYIHGIKKEKITFNFSTLFQLFLLAVFNIYLTNVLEFWSLKFLTASKTCFLYSLTPFISALLSYACFAEKMNTYKWIGMLLGVIGFSPIIFYDVPGEETLGHFLIFSWAELAMIGATIATAYGWIVFRKLMKKQTMSAVAANGYSMVIGGIFSLFHSMAVESWEPFPVTQWVPFLQSTCILAILSNFLAYNLYGLLLKRYTATFVSFAGFTTPIFASFLGWFFLNEPFSLIFTAALGMISLSLYIFYRAELVQGYITSEKPFFDWTTIRIWSKTLR